MVIRSLSDMDRSLISGALRIAAERYLADAVTSKEAGQPGLEKTFNQQVKQAHELATIFDDADAVEITTWPEAPAELEAERRAFAEEVDRGS